MLDLKLAADVDKLHALCETADILIQNLRPGVVDEIGIGPEAMLARHPRLIYCSIWAFGYQGPLKMKPGFDPLLQAYGGMMSVTGRPEDPPTFCGASINDKATGMFCAIGALAALRMRDQTGKGCLVDTSLFDFGGPLGRGSGEFLRRHRQRGAAPWHRRHRHRALPDLRLCRWPLALPGARQRPAVGALRAGARSSRMGDDPKYAKSASRVAHKTELLPLIAAAMKTRTRDQWVEAMEKAGVPCAAVNDIGELANTPQFAASELMQQLPGGDPKVVGLPITFDRKRPTSTRSAPKLGEHTDEVLSKV